MFLQLALVYVIVIAASFVLFHCPKSAKETKKTETSENDINKTYETIRKSKQFRELRKSYKGLIKRRKNLNQYIDDGHVTFQKELRKALDESQGLTAEEFRRYKKNMMEATKIFLKSFKILQNTEHTITKSIHKIETLMSILEVMQTLQVDLSKRHMQEAYTRPIICSNFSKIK